MLEHPPIRTLTTLPITSECIRTLRALYVSSYMVKVQYKAIRKLSILTNFAIGYGNEIQLHPSLQRFLQIHRPAQLPYPRRPMHRSLSRQLCTRQFRQLILKRMSKSPHHLLNYHNQLLIVPDIPSLLPDKALLCHQVNTFKGLPLK